MKTVVILGGGLAGLSAAFFSPHRWRLIEKSERVGGLAKTGLIDGFLFDPTGHWLHLRDPEITRLVTTQWLPDGLITVQRRSAIYSRGVFTRFPYQVNTHGLPAEVIAENLIGFVEAHYGEAGRELREREPKNFEEFILRYMGKGFAKNFMLPYNRKLWTVEPSQLSAAWCGRFVPKPKLKEVVEGALGIGGDDIGYNASFRYPKEGGIEALPRAILKHASGGQVSVNLEPTWIDWKSRTIGLSSGEELAYSHLISTIALPHLVRCLAAGPSLVPPEVIAAASRLKATTVTYVSVAVRGPNRHPWHWVYLPERQFRSYRIGSPSAVYPRLAPAGCCSFYVEYSHRGELSKKQCEELAVEDLLQSRMIDRAEDVLFAKASEIANAYVLYDDEYGPAKSEILKFLAHAGIQTAGRYGQWEYSSMEDAIIAGRRCAQSIAGSPSPPNG
jgi:protoporphyrinogen oxidase